MIYQWITFTQEHPFFAVLLLAVVYLIFAPPRWDPAIRIKEWQQRHRNEKKKQWWL